MAADLRQRVPSLRPVEASSPDAGPAPIAHPSGREKHGRLVQILRGVSVAVYFVTCATAYAPHRLFHPGPG